MKRENDASAPPDTLLNWYPGHMAKALREIKQKLKFVDFVLEIRDARAPLATANAALHEGVESKRKLILFNKANLADPAMLKIWGQWFEERGEAHLFFNCFEKAAMSKVIPMAKAMAQKNWVSEHPNEIAPNEKLKLMIVGLPNTGKSTIINQMANKNIAKVADTPGLTKIQQWIKIGTDVELLDTPGIMPYEIASPEYGLWLSAIHAIPDDIADEELTVEFLINHLMQRKSQAFLKRYKLESFDLAKDDILLRIATVRGCLKQKGQPDLERVYKLVLADFRTGELGRTCFSLPPA